MVAMNPGSRKIFRAKAPDKGSFPLDHDGIKMFHVDQMKNLFRPHSSECKEYMKRYMKCLRENNNGNHLCRTESKDYLQCRMDRQLMAKEDFEKLGFHQSIQLRNHNIDHDDIQNEVKSTS